MAIIPNNEKVFMVSNGTNTTYSGSAALKAMQQWYTMQDVSDSVAASAPYQSYIALFTQSGTSAPVVNIVSNTLGLNLTWARSSAGNYFGGDIASQCPDGKTVFITSNASNGGAFGIDPKEAYLWTANGGAGRFLNFNIKSINSSGASMGVDWDSPKAILIEIRVYN
jgi:hypothetical protein